MFDLVCKIFTAYAFYSQPVQTALLFSDEGTSSPKEQFWLLITQNKSGEILDKQAELFSACKKECPKPELGKNISMLVLWNIDQETEPEKIKREVMSIEENAYFFKKYVLYYSSNEHSEIIAQIGETPLDEYIKSTAANAGVFSAYKSNPNAKSWQSLLYRLVIKIPFLKIAIGTAESLESLFAENKARIAESNTAGLSDLDKQIEELFETTYVEGGKLDGEDLLKKLTMVENGN